VRQQIVGAPSSNHTYRFQNLVLDMAYRFRIRACSNSLCSAWSPPIISSTGTATADIQAQQILSPAGPPPPVPEGLRCQLGANAGSVLLDWTPLEGIDHFEIEQLELRTGGLGRQQIVGAPSSNHTYRFQNLVLDAAYRFRIRACSKSVCSDWSAPPTSSSIQRHEAR